MAAKKPVIALAGVPRVNLMPIAETQRRERISLTRTWALLSVAALVVGLLVIGAAFALGIVAQQRLAAEQARTTELLSELQSYSDVSVAVKTRGELQGFRTQAMALDAAWTPMLAMITTALPKGTALVEFTLTPGTMPVADDPTVAYGYGGVLTLSAKTAAAQAAAVAALAQVKGVKLVDAGELYTAGKDGFEFSVTIAFDQTVYSGLFAKDGGN